MTSYYSDTHYSPLDTIIDTTAGQLNGFIGNAEILPIQALVDNGKGATTVFVYLSLPLL